MESCENSISTDEGISTFSGSNTNDNMSEANTITTEMFHNAVYNEILTNLPNYSMINHYQDSGYSSNHTPGTNSIASNDTIELILPSVPGSHDGKNISIGANLFTDTVSDIKEKYRTKTGIRLNENNSLIYNGEHLNDQTKIASLNLKTRTQMHIGSKVKGG